MRIFGIKVSRAVVSLVRPPEAFECNLNLYIVVVARSEKWSLYIDNSLRLYRIAVQISSLERSCRGASPVLWSERQLSHWFVLQKPLNIFKISNIVVGARRRNVVLT
jgi:hypothetical protein